MPRSKREPEAEGARTGAAAVAPEPGAPCGNVGVPCYDGDPPVYTHECCPETFICGGGFPNIGCPPGSCCFEDRSALQGSRGEHHFSRIVSQTPDDS